MSPERGRGHCARTPDPCTTAAGGSSATVIECALIIVLIGLACITAWTHVNASLNIPSASASSIAPVETTGAIRSQGLHRAPRTRETVSLPQVPLQSP